MKTQQLRYLLFALLAAPACDADPDTAADLKDDIEAREELDDAEDGPADEIKAGQVASAQFGRPDESESEAEADAIRHRSCDSEAARDAKPKDYVMARAHGLDDPGFRLEEDQDAAARDLALDEDGGFEAPPQVPRRMSDAQARYLSEKDTLPLQERAMRKEALLAE
ncbi:MAG: hypothetical protein KUG77_20275 [Nannocystaceae bacterium]|nr:hypothetical protein [Nannocystaceae bacterium]